MGVNRAHSCAGGALGVGATAAAWALGLACAVWPMPLLARAVAAVPTQAPGDLSDHAIVAPLGPQGGAIDFTARTLTFTSHSPGAVATYLPPSVAPYGQRRAQSLAEEGLVQLVRALVLGPSIDCPAGGPLASSVDPCAPSVASALAQHTTLAPKLYACVHSMHITRSVYGADGSVTLDVALPLDLDAPGLGLLWAALLHEQAALWAPLPPAAQTLTEPTQAPNTNSKPLAQPSGIIINARGTGFVPALWPRVVDAAGTVLYGPHAVAEDVLVLRGLMGATQSLDAALSDGRVAPLALVLRAQPTKTNDLHTLVLDADDARTFVQHASLVREARLIVVVD